MREILFRGKTLTGKWVEGAYYKQELFYGDKEDADIIITSKETLDNDFALERYIVIPETVGQYTGLTDKNGKKIFEGDIVKCKDYLETKPFEFEFQGYVDFKNGSFVIVGGFMTHYRWLDYEVEVIGNIHDNPELLKEGDVK